MKHSANGSSGVHARFLRGGAVYAALMLAALAQPATADQGLQAPDIQVGGGQVAVFKFTLTSPMAAFYNTIRYAYRTRNGSAISPVDYQAKSGHVVFPHGVRSAEVRVETRNNGDTDEEYFELVLSDQQARRGDDWVPWASRDLPSTKTVRARIIDRSYGADKYGDDYDGPRFGE